MYTNNVMLFETNKHCKIDTTLGFEHHEVDTNSVVAYAFSNIFLCFISFK